ncbi:thioredoxin domain-containing protein 17-like [Anthonomus grandis grandis]|uniref:thioredoxin domain-containing protein 17-like n=1 Tax=Anthonomus grandis grandis TaxID=2921223 RepID=UPI002165A8D0|nr:thioredoxin domain-containing protein 17-like [Anthonomus grandis grandis]
MSQDSVKTTCTLGKPRVEEKLQIANSYEDYEQILSNNMNTKPLYLFFVASYSPISGYCWNPLCVEVTQFLEKYTSNITSGAFITVYVGLEDDWEDLTNPFRKDEDLQLRTLPTLMRFDTLKKLEGNFCLKEELVNLLFQDFQCQP